MTRRGSVSPGAVGFAITLDGTALAARSYYLNGVTGSLDSGQTHILTLLPGRYQFVQGNATVPEADFEVRLDGTVDYAPASDAFLSGRGTSTFGIHGLPITIDATPLAAQAYALYVTTSWLANKETHTLNLLPGHYEFQQGNGLVPEAAFDVRVDGTVDYAPTSDAFLSGRGTSTFGIHGLPIIIDATSLAAQAYAVYITTNWLANKEPHTLNLLPGHYEFQGNGLVPEAAFDVRVDGTVDYAPTSDAFLSGRGTSTFGIHGLPIIIDATPLAAQAYAVYITTSWLANKEPHKLNLLPGHYEFQQGNGLVPEAAFNVRMDGTVDYALILDVSQGGFLTGRGSTTFGIVGFPITLNGTGLVTPSYFLNGITNSMDRSKLHQLNLLPGRYQFYQGNGAVPEADFQVLMDGTVDFPPGSDAILKRRDAGRTLEIVGFAIKLDCTQPTTRGYFLEYITHTLEPAEVHTLNLLPGRYAFYLSSGAMPVANFQVRMDGSVDLPPGSDAILKWHDAGRTLEIVGFPIKLDCRQPTTRGYFLDQITTTLDPTEVHTLNLLPGPYVLYLSYGAVPVANFQVRMDGTVDLPPGSDAFLKWRDADRTLEIVGYPIKLDCTQPTTRGYFLDQITTTLDPTEVHTLNLLPGPYALYLSYGAVPVANFKVRMDGTVDLPPGSDAFLKWHDADRTLEIIGFAIKLDCRQPTTRGYFLDQITTTLDPTKVHTLNLLPGPYAFYLSNGSVPVIEFQVLIDGNVDYPPQHDVGATPPGFLSGLKSGSLNLVGFRVIVDARAYAGVEVMLMPFGLEIDTVNSQSISLLPGFGLSLELRSNDPKIALFDLAVSGKIIIDDPYAFVDIRWQGAQQVVQLIAEQFRQTGKCCLAMAGLDG